SVSAAPGIVPLSLHDALPILPEATSSRSVWTSCAMRRLLSPSATMLKDCSSGIPDFSMVASWRLNRVMSGDAILPPGWDGADARSEEHTSELQSRENLVCRLL